MKERPNLERELMAEPMERSGRRLRKMSVLNTEELLGLFILVMKATGA